MVARSAWLITAGLTPCYRTRLLVLALVPLLLLGGSACADDDDDDDDTPETVVEVTLADDSVTANVASVPAGEVRFSVNNAGTIDHEFIVLRTDTPADALPTDEDTVDEDAAGDEIEEIESFEPGETKTMDVDLEPGHYVLFCNLEQHYGNGMFSDFTVTERP